MTMSLFGTDFDKLAATMVAREKSQQVHAANIANADTPNYKADARTFADFLAEQHAGGQQGELARTQPNHMSAVFSESSDGGVYRRTINSQRMDGNTVDLQKEMAKMGEDQLMHELSMRLLKGRLGGLSNVIKEGSR